MEGDVLLVSHTHWDREWYRTFEAFRARLVDTVDRVLDQLDEDPEWRFLLDGQTIVLEDYLVVRPSRREPAGGRSLFRSARGRPVVRPTRLAPSLRREPRAQPARGSSGRATPSAGSRRSPTRRTPSVIPRSSHRCSPDSDSRRSSTGGVTATRSTGSDRSTGGRHRTAVPCSPTRSFAATSPPPACHPIPTRQPRGWKGSLRSIGPVDRAPIVLMNGVDHAYPQPHTGGGRRGARRRTDQQVASRAAGRSVGAVDPHDRPTFRGELLGGRLANLLPGVWSSRLGLKLANRRAERALFGWAEPWAALGTALGLPDESPSLRAARRALLANQAHDSIGGCSQDEVHRQMSGRFATAVELSEQTTERVLQRLAGLGPDRRMPWDLEFDVAVFNPSPLPGPTCSGSLSTDLPSFASRTTPSTSIRSRWPQGPSSVTRQTAGRFAWSAPTTRLASAWSRTCRPSTSSWSSRTFRRSAGDGSISRRATRRGRPRRRRHDHLERHPRGDARPATGRSPCRPATGG